MPDTDDATEERGRAFWSGLISFGLVSIPVDLFPAHRTSRGALRMLDADGTPLARRYCCPADGEEVDAEHLVRGYELESGEVVVVTDEELEALEPKKSREIDLRLFVPRDNIDPMYFERGYFLAPGADSGKAYRLLATVMERSRRAGIATFVMRDKEYLVAIFSDGGLLRAETLRFADEVRSVEDVGLPQPLEVEPRVSSRVRRAVDARRQKRWDPSKLEDSRAGVRALAQRKHRQKQDVVVVRPPSAPEGGEIVDLMEVLRQSLAQNDLLSAGKRRSKSSGRARPGHASSSGRAAKRRGAKSRASAKSPRRRSKSAARRPARTSSQAAVRGHTSRGRRKKMAR